VLGQRDAVDTTISVVFGSVVEPIPTRLGVLDTACFDGGMPIVGITLGAVFAFLSAFHVFWALGGKWGSAATVPLTDGKPTFTPTRGVTLLVAAALMSAALVVLTRAGVLFTWVSSWASQWTSAVLGIIFVVRSIGDFRWAGFFKSVRNTTFARWDTWLYTPLCLVLGGGALWLAFGFL
jgi:uncharacterized protein DUF3995